MSVSIGSAQTYFLVLTRTLAILTAAPVLGGRTVPPRVQLSFGLLLALILAYTLPAGPADGVDWATFGLAVGRELLVGLVASMAVRLAFAAIEAAAQLMNDTVGFGSASALNPAMVNPGSAFSQFYVMLSVLAFFLTDAHHQLLRGLARTFDLVPLGSFDLAPANAEKLLVMSGGLFVSAFQIALPVVAVMLLIDLALGLMARAAPQMNVFFVGIPVKLGVGLFIVGVALPATLPLWGGLFNTMIANMFRLIQ